MKNNIYVFYDSKKELNRFCETFKVDLKDLIGIYAGEAPYMCNQFKDSDLIIFLSSIFWDRSLSVKNFLSAKQIKSYIILLDSYKSENLYSIVEDTVNLFDEFYLKLVSREVLKEIEFRMKSILSKIGFTKEYGLDFKVEAKDQTIEFIGNNNVTELFFKILRYQVNSREGIPIITTGNLKYTESRTSEVKDYDSKYYRISFEGHVLCKLKVDRLGISIESAVDGYGDPIDNIEIKEI